MSRISAIPPPGPANTATPLGQTMATRAQAQITGAENNYSLQSTVQAQKNVEERKRVAQELIGNKLAIGTLAALEALPDMKGGHNEDDDPTQAGRGLMIRRRRNNKRKPPLPPF